jgi:rubrerythrin
MRLNTASQIISFARQLEEEGAVFYENAAKKYPANSETLMGFARENRKNITRIERAYYSGVTDAIEGGFTFDLDPEEYAAKPAGMPDRTYEDIIKSAVDMEGKNARFYEEAAAQSRSLLADLPRIFTAVAKLKNERRDMLLA